MALAHKNVASLLAKNGYTEIKKVGEGSFGKAILVSGADGSRMICKMVDVSKATRKDLDSAKSEGRMLAEFKHPYIVRYRDSFLDNGWFCILMDYCEGGDLTKRIEEARKTRTPLHEDQILTWFTQAILALKYLHQDRHILHRDLKPSNLFLSKGGTLKVGDFGIAKVLACTIANAKTQIGTPYYLSPELCQEKPYAWPSDMWSMGCILYEMCKREVPFNAPSISGLVQKIVKGPIPTVPSNYSGFVSGLVREMLNRDPQRRPGASDILSRPQIQAVVDRLAGEEPEEAVLPSPRPPMQRSNSQASVASNNSARGAPYAGAVGTYKKGDQIDYYSNSHKDWLPAVVINADEGGRIQIDLKPNTWISREEQATRVRSRGGAPHGGVPSVRGASPAPMMRRVPSAGPRPGSGFGQPSPMMGRAGSRPGSRGASPQPAAGIRRTPSIGAMGGGQPSSRAASPMIQRSPSYGGGPTPGWHPSPGRQSPSVAGNSVISVFRKGDQVDYWSPSHKDWLPATVINTDEDGRIIIDLKPNTWLSKEDQQQRVRRRGNGVGTPNGSAVQRSPSAGGLIGGTPRGSVAGVRAPSPGGWRAESPGPGGRRVEAGAGTPRMRPPGLPSGHAGHRVPDSPLRQGGRHIAGGGF
mmetsp:Transcript_18057/g.38584  ORF Transcript_18057/g.38584 Transcript_18057/m.38584 type:complete len:640 (+) Transcript_18057:144-2063(+)|eukprot:CAMPEP_0206428102 /NCGR_PEP_ID=MMETSP0324_2-20121206/5448_1 /ASSEMBLY_ACC=CAM_ASM_000836 /TAXON_ID=2866 /ORGANISM="Crypthecodinium cohnii, Strain Seligo" /LENGTH=639 /DNA_ID=CAMNT_0053893533 /DNA_START=134 /DNA_END=2053 /DNA_ORIENTATION=-